MKHSVLVVEDDADLSNLYCLFLTGEGFNVQAAASGEEAVDIALKTHFDLIFLDLTLPAMMGPEVLDILRDHYQLNPIKVIVTSGWDKLDRIAAEMEADGFATKPVNLEALSAQISALLRAEL